MHWPWQANRGRRRSRERERRRARRNESDAASAAMKAAPRDQEIAAAKTRTKGLAGKQRKPRRPSSFPRFSGFAARVHCHARRAVVHYSARLLCARLLEEGDDTPRSRARWRPAGSVPSLCKRGLLFSLIVGTRRTVDGGSSLPPRRFLHSSDHVTRRHRRLVLCAATVGCKKRCCRNTLSYQRLRLSRQRSFCLKWELEVGLLERKKEKKK